MKKREKKIIPRWRFVLYTILYLLLALVILSITFISPLLDELYQFINNQLYHGLGTPNANYILIVVAVNVIETIENILTMVLLYFFMRKYTVKEEHIKSMYLFMLFFWYVVDLVPFFEFNDFLNRFNPSFIVETTLIIFQIIIIYFLHKKLFHKWIAKRDSK